MLGRILRGVATGGLSEAGIAGAGAANDIGKKFGSRIGQGEDLAGRQVDPNLGSVQGYGSRQARLTQAGYDASQRKAPKAGRSAFRADQRGYINRLDAQSRGEGPSLARMQAQEALQRGVSTQQALAAGARPGQQGAAARQASQQGSLLAGSVAGASAQGRAQEQLGAMQQLGGAIQGARGQDQSLALANQQARLSQTGLNDAQLRAMYGMELNQAGMQQEADLRRQQLKNQLITGALQTPTQTELGAGFITGGLQAGLQAFG